ncbi:hypothetical protein JCM33374_g4119 [Metschnikowia sp. JCM 33374]|nr:hypothetical protein JCM33374_g4119 [Metschnikowia sp. JCM 33374]
MSDDYSEMTEKLNEIAASLHSQSTSGRSSSTGSVITTTPSSYIATSVLIRTLGSVYKVVHQPVSAYSFDAHIFFAETSTGYGPFPSPIAAAYCTLSPKEFADSFTGESRAVAAAVFAVESTFSDFVHRSIGKHSSFNFAGAHLNREYVETYVKDICAADAHPLVVNQRKTDLINRASGGDVTSLVHFMQAHGFDEQTIWLEVTTALNARVQGEKHFKKYKTEWKALEHLPGGILNSALNIFTECKKLDLFQKKPNGHSGSQSSQSATPAKNGRANQTKGKSTTAQPKKKTLEETVTLLADHVATLQQSLSTQQPKDVHEFLADFSNTHSGAYKQCRKLFRWDNGSPIHIVNDDSLFSTFMKSKRSLFGIAGIHTNVSYVGTVNLKLLDGTPFTLQDVHYVPGCPANVISPFRLPQLFMTWPDQRVTNIKTGSIIGKPFQDKIFVPVDVIYPVAKTIPGTTALLALEDADSSESTDEDFMDLTDLDCAPNDDDESSIPPALRGKQPSAESQKWHDALGHPNARVFAIQKKKLGLKNVEHVPASRCFGCSTSKATRVIPKVSRGLTVVTGPFEIIHADVCGQIDKPISWDNAAYFLTIVDRFSRRVVACPLEDKADASLYLQQYLTESYTSLRAKHWPIQLRTDNGTEFMTPALLYFLQQRGIKRQLTTPYSSYQNGLAERMHRTLQDFTRTLLSQGNVPLIFWSEAVRVAAMYINLMPREILDWFSPDECWFASDPKAPTALPLPELHPFGCVAFAQYPRELRTNKFAPSATACAYLGPATNRAGYRLFCYDPPCVFESSQVTFRDDEYYFKRFAPGTSTYEALKTKVPNALLPGLNYPPPAKILNDIERADDRARLKALFDFSQKSLGTARNAARRPADEEAPNSRQRKARRVNQPPTSSSPTQTPPVVPILPSQPTPSSIPDVSPPPSNVLLPVPPSSARTPPEKPPASSPASSSGPIATEMSVPTSNISSKSSTSSTPVNLPAAQREPVVSPERPATHAEVTSPPGLSSSQIANASLDMPPVMTPPTSTSKSSSGISRPHGMTLRPRDPKSHRVQKPSVKAPKHSHLKTLMSAHVAARDKDNNALLVRVLNRRDTPNNDSLAPDPDATDVFLCDHEAFDLDYSLQHSLTAVDVLYATEADLHESSFSSHEIPNSYQAAMKAPENKFWKDACNAEMQAHEDNGTWTLVPRPPGSKPIGCRWVFTIKDTGLYKARLVAKGYTQVKGLDFEETYSPVINKPSLRLMFGLAARMKFQIHQMDVKTAFLNGVLEEEIYMTVPPGFTNPVTKGKHKDYVLRLNKSLYGLKQAPLVWNKTMNAELEKQGFKGAVNEPCLYYKGQGSSLIVIALYVDDLLIFGKDETEILRVKRDLSLTFQMKDLGQAKKFLGINVDIRSSFIKLHMADYITSTLQEFGLQDANPNLLPWKPDFDLDSFEDDDDPDVDMTEYRSIVGKIIYAAFTCRYDIAFYASRLSRYLTRPKQKHMDAARSTLKYLKGTMYHGIVYGATTSPDIVCFSDADFASQRDAGSKSTTGFLIMYAGAPFSWKSKLQTLVATSTLNAELIALYQTVLEAVWLSNLLGELGFDHKIHLFCDNDGTIKTAHTQALLEGTKHVRVKVDFVRQKVHARDVFLSRVDTHDNVADMLTKALVADTFKKHRTQSNMRDVGFGGNVECRVTASRLGR